MDPNEAFYNSDRIPQSGDRLTPEQKLELLDWHPLFTGRCPNCAAHTTDNAATGSVGVWGVWVGE